MSRFLSVFKDNNDWNEKTIIGAISFAMMVVTAAIDVVTGVWGMQLKVQEFIYNSFLIITLGCFSISGIEKWAPNKCDKCPS
jgi:Mg2+ and Co2+ transporter CorA